MRLIIAEKAKMARALRDGLPKPFDSHISDKGLVGYYESKDEIITFARGHLLKMYDVDDYLGEKTPWEEVELPYLPENWRYKPISDEFSKKQLAVIRKLVADPRITEIVHLGDPDREGELLIRLILMFCRNKKPVKRMLCKAIVPEVAADAYRNLEPIENTDSWFSEGVARQRIDWLWGINLTRLLTQKAGTLLPVGRVLVPIVKFIYDREMKISGFVKSYSWGVDGKLTKGNFSTILRNKALEFDEAGKADAEKAAAKLQAEKGAVTAVNEKVVTKSPLKLFSLLKLQAELNKRYKMSVEASMKIIQDLYLNGYLTYPRTSTEYISEKEIDHVKEIIRVLQSVGEPVSFHKKKSVFDESKCESGHTALTITQKLPDLSSLSDDERKVYLVVYNRFVSNFYDTPTTVKETTVTIQVGNIEYKVIGDELVIEGFYKAEPQRLRATLPVFTVGEIPNIVFSAEQRETQPPKKVTVTELLDYLKNPYKDLIKKMDSDDELYAMMKDGCTIGTEATTTGIIANAVKYEYISSEKSSFSLEPKGKALIQLLDTLNINLYRDKNVDFNKTLKKVYRCEMTMAEAVEDTQTQLKQTADVVKKTAAPKIEGLSTSQKGAVLGKCPLCGGDIKVSKKGYFCCNWNAEPACRFFFKKEHPQLQGKSVSETQMKALLGPSGKALFRGLLSKSGKKYDAYMALEDTGKYINLKFIEFAAPKKKKEK